MSDDENQDPGLAVVVFEQRTKCRIKELELKLQESDYRADKDKNEYKDEDVTRNPNRDRLMHGFEHLIDFLPWMREKLVSMDPLYLDNLYKELRKGADNARSDDAASLKGAVITWLHELYGPIEPVLCPNTRGLDHDVTGHWIAHTTDIGVNTGSYDEGTNNEPHQDPHSYLLKLGNSSVTSWVNLSLRSSRLE
ncbi:hypothetical protein BV22DRAFT_1052486 [Leucogyrophana mollusca]|uniref:Uncharacterized protein n=1 Tax=Leucogyrophana mollusca TaxID=85980 RepID=A0ACB8AW04_9AGAM|nr:hypothetical protein BV22DRAFT_1052486 [Leucogyrophana mollusca]